MEHGTDLPSCGTNLGGGQGSGSKVIPDPVRLSQLELAAEPEQICEPPVILRPLAMVGMLWCPWSDTDKEEVGEDAKQESGRMKISFRINLQKRGEKD